MPSCVGDLHLLTEGCSMQQLIRWRTQMIG